MKSIFFVLIFFLLASCNNNSPKEETTLNLLINMEWLIGSWKMDNQDGTLYESWTKKNDTVLIGKSIMIKELDTIYTEKLSIVFTNGHLYYIPAVSNQNDGMPIMFHLISSEQNHFVFENKLHDFPQRIVYDHPSEDSLYAYIDGIEKGKPLTIAFPMNKIKNEL